MQGFMVFISAVCPCCGKGHTVVDPYEIQAANAHQALSQAILRVPEITFDLGTQLKILLAPIMDEPMAAGWQPLQGDE